MDVLYRQERATAGEIRAALPDAPSYSAVRAKLRVLEEKGHVRHKAEDLRYVYVPRVPRGVARHSALRHLVDTFFNGSVKDTVAALLDDSAASISREDLDRIALLVEQARKGGA